MQQITIQGLCESCKKEDATQPLVTGANAENVTLLCDSCFNSVMKATFPWINPNEEGN